MLLLSLLVSQSVHAADCSVDRILQNPKSTCAKDFIKRIPDEQDRSEFKFRLSHWKAPKGLKVYSDHGFIEAQVNGQSIARAVWLQYRNPAILWFNGKILTDKSNNPSWARTLDKMFRESATASMIVPEAFAQSENDAAKNVLFFYSIDAAMAEPKLASDAAQAKKSLTQFMPPSNPLLNFFGGPAVNCASKNTVDAKLVELNPGTNEMQVLITPKSPTQFKLTGIEKNKTHLVTLTTFTLRLGDQVKTVLHPTFSFAGATIAECVDEKCDSTVNTIAYQEREFVHGYSPAKEKEAAARRTPNEKAEAQMVNDERRSLLGARMFGMSLMGNCCSNTICADELKKNYNVNIVPASTSGTTTH